MALPKKIQQQAEAVAQLEEQMAAATQETEPTAPPVEEPTPPAEPQGNSPAAEPQHAPPADDVAQKYRTLQGMYNSAMQRLTNLSSEVEQLKGELLKARRVEEAPEAPDTSLISPKDVETYGEDLIDLASRIAQKEIAKSSRAYERQIAELTGRLNEQIGEVKTRQVASAEDLFFERLTRAKPDWEALQATSECQEWLGMRPPGVDATWNDILVAAAKKHDVQRVLEVFQTFEATRPKREAAPTPKTSNELQRQVAPSKSKAGSVSSDKRVYSFAEYEREMRNVASLQKSGRYDEAQRLEKDLDAAFVEGRVRP